MPVRAIFHKCCDLNIEYSYLYHTGRGRAKDSKCYLITSKHEQAEKEEINLLHEVLMNDAVAVLQKKDRTEFIRQVILAVVLILW